MEKKELRVEENNGSNGLKREFGTAVWVFVRDDREKSMSETQKTAETVKFQCPGILRHDLG